MTPTIYLALTHDWELRGDGSGDIEQIQFAPLRELLQVYARAGARTTFLPDVMQQLTFRQHESSHCELKALADSWDEHVRDAFRHGHDVQLHLHPQWLNATHENGRWYLDGDWSILNYNRETAYAMLAGAKEYLENLLRPLDSKYRCLAFRAGALAAAPSVHLFESLVSLGIQLDVSIAGGLFVNNRNLHLDYRNCEERFLPFYPSMTDARKLSGKQENIVCVPLNHFYGSRRAVAQQNLTLVRREVERRRRGAGSKGRESQTSELSESGPSRVALLYEKLILPVVKRKYFVSDTGRLNYPLMQEMLESIRRRARASGLPHVPIVLTNHPKDIRDLAAIERFVGEVSQAEDVKFITLTELAAKLRRNEFQIRSKPR